jgi:hypothetical protein
VAIDKYRFAGIADHSCRLYLSTVAKKKIFKVKNRVALSITLLSIFYLCTSFKMDE